MAYANEKIGLLSKRKWCVNLLNSMKLTYCGQLFYLFLEYYVKSNIKKIIWTW